MIEAVGLTKRYGAKTAVYNLSFQVRPGAVTGFLGPNGSGKSTTMRMILGLDQPDRRAGDDRRLSLPQAAQRPAPGRGAAGRQGRARRPQRPQPPAVASPSCPASRPGGWTRCSGVVGLQDVARKRSKGFSLGMGQRLGIAAALLGDPQVLLFDEPVNGLDPEGILWVRNLMKQLAAEGRTVFVSSPSDERDGADRRPPHRDRPRTAARRHERQGLHLAQLGRTSPGCAPPTPSRSSARSCRPRSPRRAARSCRSRTARCGSPGCRCPRISDLAHGADVRLWELSPHQASLEEAYMRMTQGAVDYRSTDDQKAGLMQPPPLGTPSRRSRCVGPEVPQPGWYAPPPPAGQAAARAAAGRAGHAPARPCRAPGPARPAAPAPRASARLTRPRQPAPHRRAPQAAAPAGAPSRARARAGPRPDLRPDQARGRPMTTPVPAAGRAPRRPPTPRPPYPPAGYTSPIPVRAHAPRRRPRLRVDQDPFGALHDVDARRHDRADVVGIGLLSAVAVSALRRRLCRRESVLCLGFFGAAARLASA